MTDKEKQDPCEMDEGEEVYEPDESEKILEAFRLENTSLMEVFAERYFRLMGWGPVIGDPGEKLFCRPSPMEGESGLEGAQQALDAQEAVEAIILEAMRAHLKNLDY